MSASTTQKMTKKHIETIKDHLVNGDGVIVRYKGIEYGVVGYRAGKFQTFEGVDLDPKQLTIRKGLPLVESPFLMTAEESFKNIEPVLTAVLGDRPGEVKLKLVEHRYAFD